MEDPSNVFLYGPDGKPIELPNPASSLGADQPPRSAANKIERETPRWKKTAEIAAVAIAFLLLIINACQMYLSRETMRVDERAWVTAIRAPFAFPAGGRGVFHGHFENLGKTPAINVQTCIAATVLGPDDTIEFNYEPGTGHPCTVSHLSIFFPGDSPPEFSAFIFRSGTKKGEQVLFTPELIGLVQSGRAYLVMHGKLTYSDIFGVDHWTQFCGLYPESLPLGETPHRLQNDCIAYNQLDPKR